MAVEFSWPTVMYGMWCFLVSGWLVRDLATLGPESCGRLPGSAPVLDRERTGAVVRRSFNPSHRRDRRDTIAAWKGF
ncbi:hypothetical protein GCM10010255_44060 [Streptomyces coeruleofuscus]|uniref:Secreted protein n=1 Tax=Streptomyces coeruleofuscus TaxID=66879 RepID=A0ABP5VJ72_9ACTN